MTCKFCKCLIEKRDNRWLHMSIMDAVRCVKTGGKLDTEPTGAKLEGRDGDANG